MIFYVTALLRVLYNRYDHQGLVRVLIGLNDNSMSCHVPKLISHLCLYLCYRVNVFPHVQILFSEPILTYE